MSSSAAGTGAGSPVRDDLAVSVGPDMVAVVELRRAPNNYFDLPLIRAVADAYEALGADPRCRAVVLCSQGKHFCAGAEFRPASPSTSGGDSVQEGPAALYREAIRLFEGELPVVAAVQGAAIGGGLGLACSADFRVGCPDARFAASFAQLGFHHGFALSVSLPAIVGQQQGWELLYTGRRIDGVEAGRIGLCDRLVDAADVRTTAHALAAELAGSAPLALRSIRQTMRAEMLARLPAAVEREAAEQLRLRRTADWAEGLRASAERRAPRFSGQ